MELQAMLTLQEVQDSLPAGQKGVITQDMVNQLNALSKDPEEARYIRENFISFSQVLSEGRFKLGDYVRAVMYVSHKVMGKSNLDSYKATFPDRYAQMVSDGRQPKDIASYVAAYNKGKLVNLVYERAMIPTWVLNQDMFQAALNVNYEIMNDVTVSDKVRVEAANSILTHLKKPETNKAELKIDIGLNDGMKALEQRLSEMAEVQLKTIEGRAMTVEEVAGLPLNVPEAEIVDE
jgi:hypothetical protein